MTILILCLPVLELCCIYFLSSQSAQATQNKYAQVQEESPIETDPDVMWGSEESSQSAAVQSRYIPSILQFPGFNNNTTAEYFQAGDDMFPAYS